MDWYICNKRTLRFNNSYSLLLSIFQLLSSSSAKIPFDYFQYNLYYLYYYFSTLYALPAFYGFLSRRDIDGINAMFRKARRWGMTVDEFDMDLLSTISDPGLFKKIGNENHCLYQLLPKVHEVPSYNLRPKPTVYNLPCPKIKKLLNSFIYRCDQINL